MASRVTSILSWSRRHRLVIAAGIVCLAAVSAGGMRRLTFDTDVLSLLPRDGRVIPAFRIFLQRFGSVDQLYVVFTAPAGQSIADYDSEVDDWIRALRRTPEIARVDSGLIDTSRDLSWLADRQLLLLGDGTLAKALARFQQDGMKAAIVDRRELLTVPSPAVSTLVRHDPLGLYDLVRAELGGTQAGLNLGATQVGYVTPDGRSRMVIAQPVRPPYDAEFSRALFARLDSLRTELAHSGVRRDDTQEPRAPLDVQFAGGHRIALETERLVRRESILNTIGSLALILPLLFLVFRSAWLVAVGALPSSLSLLVVLGILGLLGATLSAAATASAAMLFGLGVDGVVLLYVAYTLALADGAQPDAAIDGLGAPAFSMLLGMWTTAATFYGLAFVDFPSLEQLGRLIGHSMLLCGLFTLVIVPATLPRKRRRTAVRRLTMPRLAAWVETRRRSILIGTVLATVLLAAAATRLRIDPTLDRLRSVTPGARFQESLGPMFGLPHDVYVILSEGKDLQALLRTNEQLVDAFTRSLPRVALQAPSILLPSDTTQAHRLTAIRLAGLSPDAVVATLADASRSAGFKPDSFAPFTERIPALLDRTHRMSYDGYVEHGLGDLIGRFVSRSPNGWLLATYAFPSGATEAAQFGTIVATMDPAATLTGLPLVNRELSDRFLPQFMKGLAIGTIIVIGLVIAAFRDWWLSLLSLTPTAVGLVWAAGVLAIARVELDLFALFAVATFVGIGVDYGIHLVHRSRERGDAIHAIEELAPVILVAAAITLLGYGTLVTSTYPPLRSIGVVSAVSVVTLAIASVLVLPAMLAKPRDPGLEASEVSTSDVRIDSPEDLSSAALSRDAVPRRWTLHGLNNGLIFAATYHGVRVLPRPISYAIGRSGTWIAWRFMRRSRDAIADNLAAVLPTSSRATLERVALETLRSYAHDVIDFLKALSAPPEAAPMIFDMADEYRQLFERLRSEGRGILLVTGHYGNWEVGSILIRRGVDLPLTIVAMTEADAGVNRIRRDIRESLGADTIEVRQSLDTPLQIRRRLGENQIVAMLVDRHYGRDRVAVTMFGRSAWFLRTPFVMAQVTGAPLLPCFVERIGPGRFAATPESPIFVATDIPRDEAISRAAQQVADTLAARVTRHPEFWYHFYRYWDAQRDSYEGLS